jgi:hypothetical protein
MRVIKNDTIAMGRDGYPLFWKEWPEPYKRAWMQSIKERVNARLGFDLEEVVSAALGKLIREKVAEVKARERQQRLALYKRYDREARLTESMSAAAKSLAARESLARKFPAARPITRAAVPVAAKPLTKAALRSWVDDVKATIKRAK